MLKWLLITPTYFTIGKLLATCLVQGGQPTVCFSPGVADGEVMSNPCLKDIPSQDVQETLRKVRTCTYIQLLCTVL